jgi:hypothetical protein
MAEFLILFSAIVKNDYRIEDYDPDKQAAQFQHLKDHISQFVVRKRILDRSRSAVIAGDYSTKSIASYLLQFVDLEEKGLLKGFYIIELMLQILNST